MTKKHNKIKKTDKSTLTDVRLDGLKVTELPKISVPMQTVNMKIAERFGLSVSLSDENVHVIHSQKGWAVKREGEKIVLAVEPTKYSAIRVAKKIQSAKKIIVHNLNGTIQSNKLK